MTDDCVVISLQLFICLIKIIIATQTVQIENHCLTFEFEKPSWISAHKYSVLNNLIQYLLIIINSFCLTLYFQNYKYSKIGYYGHETHFVIMNNDRTILIIYWYYILE